MKKKYKCEIDCANCAQRLQDALSRLPGVEDVSVSFLFQRLTLSAPSERYDEVLASVLARAKQLQPDTVITV
ncbi:MAG: cation transporter [Oscillospiraceae bacterium]|nr:cation transporter [Oscillospiraceae bacterium]